MNTTEHDGADEFNTAHPVGTPVLAFPGAREGRALHTRTRTPAWNLGGRPVVSVEGYAGGIALTHIEIIEEDTMTTDDFTTAARAEAGTLYAVDWDTPAYYDEEDRQEAEQFLAGAEWARDHLAAEIRKAQADAWEDGYNDGLNDSINNAPIEAPNPYSDQEAD